MEDFWMAAFCTNCNAFIILQVVLRCFVLLLPRLTDILSMICLDPLIQNNQSIVPQETESESQHQQEDKLVGQTLGRKLCGIMTRCILSECTSIQI